MPGNPDVRLTRARAGDTRAREDLIDAYTPFVLRVAARTCGRFVRIGQDDEVSVALIAFNEAIDRYDERGGASFLTFAEMVIRRRLIDHFRVERRPREVPLADFEQVDEEGQTFNAVEVQGALAAHSEEEQAARRREDILRFRELLKDYGLSMEDLVRAAPRHEDARLRAMAVARRVAGHKPYAAYLRAHRELPLKELAAERDIGVSRKTLERQRKYVVAIALILMENLETLREYIKA